MRIAARSHSRSLGNWKVSFRRKLLKFNKLSAWHTTSRSGLLSDILDCYCYCFCSAWWPRISQYNEAKSISISANPYSLYWTSHWQRQTKLFEVTLRASDGLLQGGICSLFRNETIHATVCSICRQFFPTRSTKLISLIVTIMRTNVWKCLT